MARHVSTRMTKVGLIFKCREIRVISAFPISHLTCLFVMIQDLIFFVPRGDKQRERNYCGCCWQRLEATGFLPRTWSLGDCCPCFWCFRMMLMVIQGIHKEYTWYSFQANCSSLYTAMRCSARHYQRVIFQKRAREGRTVTQKPFC